MLNVNSFLLGARSVDPSITCQVIFTGEWSMAVREAEATNALVDQGADVVTCHVDGPKVVIETAAGRGAYVCGYHADQSPLAPEQYLTGAEWNWADVYTGMVKTVQAGGTIDNFVRGGLAEGFIKMSDLGPINGPMKDNEGNEIAAAGESFEETDVALESMDYLVEGVIGSAS